MSGESCSRGEGWGTVRGRLVSCCWVIFQIFGDRSTIFCLFFRYLGTEGWAPASYLKKIKDDFSPRKKTLTGPVEIIGNIMEISNLLQKKSVSEKDIQTEGDAPGSAPERHISKSEISLPVPYNSQINAETGRRLSAGRDTNSPCLGIAAASSAHSKERAEPGSPAVARVAPHRVVESGEFSWKTWGSTAGVSNSVSFRVHIQSDVIPSGRDL